MLMRVKWSFKHFLKQKNNTCTSERISITATVKILAYKGENNVLLNQCGIFWLPETLSVVDKL